MATKKETREIEYCDICNREYKGFMQPCFVCGGDMCLSCNAPSREGTYFNYKRLCKKCFDKPEVKKIQRKYRKLYWKYQIKEQEAFSKVKKREVV